MKSNKTAWLILVIIIIFGSILYLEYKKGSLFPSPVKEITTEGGEADSKKIKEFVKAKEFVDPAGFINTEEFQLSEVVGKKVILLDIWTYSCINCQRTLPYITEWYSKYRDQGLEIVGVHSPEFEFEKLRSPRILYDIVKKASLKADQQRGVVHLE